MVAVRSACLLESQRSAAHGREADALAKKVPMEHHPLSDSYDALLSLI